MNDYLITIDQVLKNLLQKDIRFILNNQITKEGKFILYNHGYFLFNFNIKNYKKNKLEILKLPIPFNFEYYKEEGLIYFDYRIKSFSHSDNDIDKLIKGVKKPHISKYYDKILTIEEIKR